MTATVIATETWTYTMGRAEDGDDITAQINVNLWDDGVVLASAVGLDENRDLQTASFRGEIVKGPAYLKNSPWYLYADGRGLITTERTRRSALQVAGNFAINAWCAPTRERDGAARRARIAERIAARRAAQTPHTINGQTAEQAPDLFTYGHTHDMDCPGCAGTPFTASPRSETYWAS